MGQVKNSEATQKYCMQGIYFAVIRKNDVEMYQRYLSFAPFCNTFASLFLLDPYATCSSSLLGAHSVSHMGHVMSHMMSHMSHIMSHMMSHVISHVMIT